MKDDILLIPRNILEVDNILNEKIHFIVKRYKDKAIKLDKPTKESHKALSSGIRSNIVKGKDGNYYRQKGVALDVYMSNNQPFGNGMHDITKLESRFALILSRKKLPFSVMEPVGFEKYLIINNVDKSASKEISKYVKENKILCGIDNDRAYNNFITYRSGGVPIFKIKGDTRLDELIYHMTLRDYPDIIRKQRNNFLEKISYNVGIGLAQMALSGFCYGSQSCVTNNHIGNFVIFKEKDFLMSGFVDLGGLDDSGIRHAKDESLRDVAALEEDFTDAPVYSMDDDYQYKEFPRMLADKFYRQLMKGYAEGIKIVKGQKESCMVIKKYRRGKDIILPKQIPVYVEEFYDIWSKIDKIKNYKKSR